MGEFQEAFAEKDHKIKKIEEINTFICNENEDLRDKMRNIVDKDKCLKDFQLINCKVKEDIELCKLDLKKKEDAIEKLESEKGDFKRIIDQQEVGSLLLKQKQISNEKLIEDLKSEMREMKSRAILEDIEILDVEKRCKKEQLKSENLEDTLKIKDS